MIVIRVPSGRRRRPLVVSGTLLLWSVAFLTSCSTGVQGFGLVVAAHHHYRIHLWSLFGSLDYEYIIPSEDSADGRRTIHKPSSSSGAGGEWWSLSSSFPEDTPAGLRGEAIRSALRSRRCCVGWNGDDDDGGGGVVLIQGAGTRDFLNNKLTQAFPATASSSNNADNNNNNFYYYTEACLLTPKGRVVDRLGVAYGHGDNNNNPNNWAYLIPSRGHTARALFDRLNPFLFPLDQVQLTCLDAPCCRSFSLASVDRDTVQTCCNPWMGPHSTMRRNQNAISSADTLPQLPEPNQCSRIPLPHDDEDSASSSSSSSFLLTIPSSGLPAHAGAGYTFFFLGAAAAAALGDQIWNDLCQNDDSNVVVAGPREFESLRIEAGQPAFGYEMTGALEQGDPTATTESTTQTAATPASPMELHLLESTVRLDKGCYLGQEGVASQYKNPRGPPRTLYHVVFPDDLNLYAHQTRGEATSRNKFPLDNTTRVPVRGDTLYALGSNAQILVGTLTSVAEPSSTGESAVRALALVRRADSIVKQMRNMNLEIPEVVAPLETSTTSIDNDTGILAPPPLNDPLEGLEVIVGGTFTVGRLETVPIRRRRSSSMFDGVVPEFVQNLPGEDAQNDILDVSSRTIVEESTSAGTQKAAATAAAKAEYEAAEAQRKAEKMKQLQERAAEALARRIQKKIE